MSDSIIIIEKPDWISWEDIRQCVFDAHSDNRKRGITMRAPLSSSSAMAEKVGEEGKTFVALDGEKVVGTASIAIKQMSLWCGNCNYGFYCLAGVLPDYSGKGIYKQLCSLRESFAKSLGIDMLCFDTNEKNSKVISIAKNNGFEYVDLRYCGDHYNIVMVKWLYLKPYSSRYIKLQYTLRFLLKKVYYRLRKVVKRTLSFFSFL